MRHVWRANHHEDSHQRNMRVCGEHDCPALEGAARFSFAYDFTPYVEQTSVDQSYFDLTGAQKALLDIAQPGSNFNIR
jgi:hypothetical protein